MVVLLMFESLPPVLITGGALPHEDDPLLKLDELLLLFYYTSLSLL